MGPRNRSNKTAVTFNTDARREFLTGFSKRKQERKKKAQIKKIAQHKEEIRQARLALRQGGDDAPSDALEANVKKDQISSQSVLDAGSHTVTVTHVDTFQHNFNPEVRKASDSKGGASKAEQNKLKKLQIKKVGPAPPKSAKSTKSASKVKKFGRKSTKSKRTKHFHPTKITT